MQKAKIALIHCPKSNTYQLVKLLKKVDVSDPCLMWVFDISRLNTAKKIMKNMNLAHEIYGSSTTLIARSSGLQ